MPMHPEFVYVGREDDLVAAREAEDTEAAKNGNAR